VTGGSGFIGSHLAEDALGRGAAVTVLGLADRPEERRNLALLAGRGARVVVGSVTDPAAVAEALAGATHVDHLAVAMREAGLADRHFEEINLEGTRRLLEAARARGVERFVFCSTIGIFGHRVAGVVREDSPLAPGNVYERSKVAAEALVREVHAAAGLPAVILRPADVYGPRDERLRKLFQAVEAGRFPLFGDGGGRRHMVYVDDVVRAFRRARACEAAVGEAFLIAGPEVCTLRELLAEIVAASGGDRFGWRLPLAPMRLVAALVEDACTALGVTPPLYRRRMDFFDSDSAFDVSKARALLGWEPRVGIAEGVRLTLAAYREPAAASARAREFAR
jgi:nucleoside-diphosphate-sugar epimerase